MERMRILLFVLIFAMAISLMGCTAEKYGAGIDRGAATLKVKDILLDRSNIGRTVNLEGKISSQCGSNGCWFVLQDDTGQIFINLAPNNMSVPPRMNKDAKVTGIVSPFEGQLQIIAQGVEVR